MSPAFQFGGKALFEFVSRTPTPEVSRIYVDCGAREAGGRMFAVAERMVRLLERKGYGEGQLLWRPDPRGIHHERAWSRRAPQALSFMFRK